MAGGSVYLLGERGVGAPTAARAVANTGTSPLRRGYLVRRPLSNLLLRAADGALRLAGAGRHSRAAVPVPRPERLLLCVGGHLGDAVIATSVLPILAEMLPDTEIGILVGSWSRGIVEAHPNISRIHTVDHWRVNRETMSGARKIAAYRRDVRQALREIRDARYDVAIDLYPYSPNHIPLLWRAGIPVRIGYTSGGFGPLLTHPREWVDRDQHVAEYHLDLLRILLPDLPRDYELAYSLGVAGERLARSVVAEYDPREGDYLVVHMGVGARFRQWPEHAWCEVVSRLAADGHRIVFTGVGEEETSAAERVAAHAPGSVNLCGRLSWDDFLATLRSARLLLCMDSLAAHLAAGLSTPCVVIMSGISNPHHWRPLSSSALPVLNHTPCAPCHQSSGCPGMECVRELPATTVLAAANRVLRDMDDLV